MENLWKIYGTSMESLVESLWNLDGISIGIHPMKYYLVGGRPTPLKKMCKSIGMMKFPTE